MDDRLGVASSHLRLSGVAALAQYRQCAFAGEVVLSNRPAQWRGVTVNHLLGPLKRKLC